MANQNVSNVNKTAFICDESYFWHFAGSGALFLPPGGYVQADTYVEDPESKRRVKNLLERSGFINHLLPIKPRPATFKDVARVHHGDYIRNVQTLSETTGGDAGHLAIVGKDSYEIALLSAGGALTAVDAVMQGQARNVYALVRPPGHHAGPDAGMGFCLFNNVSIAAKYALEVYGLERVLILDWDVHHGNGTETTFYDDPRVLFISLHENRNFPMDRGFATDVGEKNGRGFNVNIPLPPGTSDAGYLYAFDQVVKPIAKQFRPQLVLVSAGQDPNFFDPLAHMLVSSDGFRRFAEIAVEIAEAHCHGRLVACHEGGYSTAYVPFCTLAVIEGMTGLSSGVEDPFQITISPYQKATLYDHQKAAVDEVRRIQSEFWKFED